MIKPMNKSASRALDILAMLAKENRPLMLKEIGAALELPKSSTFEIVYTMLARGFLEQDENKKFSLGLKTFEIGSAYLKGVDVVQAAIPYLEALAKLVNETVFLAVNKDSRIVYLYKAIGSSNIVHTCDLGSHNSMHCTGLGKALLAGYSDERVRKIAEDQTLTRLAQRTLTSLDDLFEELSKTRERGYAVDDRENRDDSFCVAAPLFSTHKEPIAAISVATFFFKIDERYYDLLSREVPKTAMEISRKMGFTNKRFYE